MPLIGLARAVTGPARLFAPMGRGRPHPRGRRRVGVFAGRHRSNTSPS